MHVRQVACALPLLLLSAACGSAAPTDADVTAASQELRHHQPNYQRMYDKFDGDFNVASFTGTIARTGGLTGAPVEADFYYPDGCGRAKPNDSEDKKWKRCKKAGGRTRADFADAFPMVPVLQGGNVPRAQYSEFAKELASYGFVVVVPDLQQTFGPPGSPALYFTSQWVANWVANDLTARDADSSSPLSAIVDTASMGLTGHSFGAAAASAVVQGTCQPPFCFGPPFAYQRPASLKAAVLHGFQNCDPSAGQCFYPDTSAAPTAIINGGLDDPGAPTLSAYQSLELPRGLVVVDDANHFGLTNQDLSAPGSPNPEPNGLPQEESIEATARWTAIWFATHLSGDEDAMSLMESGEAICGFSVTSEL